MKVFASTEKMVNDQYVACRVTNSKKEFLRTIEEDAENYQVCIGRGKLSPCVLGKYKLLNTKTSKTPGVKFSVKISWLQKDRELNT